MSKRKKEPPNKRVGQAMLTFVAHMMECSQTDDHAMRQVHTETYRREVHRAYAAGFECSLSWHTLAAWTEEGKERIGYFANTLRCLEAEKAELSTSVRGLWTNAHTRADCLFEIGRIHAAEGDAEVARDFLEQARALMPIIDIIREACIEEGFTPCEDLLEGRIAEILLQLPDPEEPKPEAP